VELEVWEAHLVLGFDLYAAQDVGFDHVVTGMNSRAVFYNNTWLFNTSIQFLA